uniref:MULE transposase domain-containing protein n=1 Tax=Timema monikensis TaxID=170555 RepID=A0A7R9HVN8_9NEOP|nr:unnamed protein product [Timema monikensis]
MKTQNIQAYEAVFIHLKMIIPSLSPKFIISDYESAIKVSVARHFPATKHIGCWFHFSQGVAAITDVSKTQPEDDAPAIQLNLVRTQRTARQTSRGHRAGRRRSGPSIINRESGLVSRKLLVTPACSSDSKKEGEIS